MTDKLNAKSVMGAFEVVVFDYDGVCTPSPGEFIQSESAPLAALRPRLSSVIGEFRDRGSVIVLLSNEFDRDWMAEIEGFPAFDHVCVGSDNQIFKPDRRAFQRVLHVTGCDAGKCLVIDDDETNCRVARSTGCETICFDPANVASSWAAVLAASPVTR